MDSEIWSGRLRFLTWGMTNVETPLEHVDAAIKEVIDSGRYGSENDFLDAIQAALQSGETLIDHFTEMVTEDTMRAFLRAVEIRLLERRRGG